jgi:hypothetical protein
MRVICAPTEVTGEESLLYLTGEKKRARLNSLRKNALGCHSERSEESGVDPKRLRSGNFLRASSGMPFHRGAIPDFFHNL